MAPRGTYQHDCAPRSQGIGPATWERSRERRLSLNEHEGALFPPPTQASWVSNVIMAPRATTSHLCPSGSAPGKAP